MSIFSVDGGWVGLRVFLHTAANNQTIRLAAIVRGETVPRSRVSCAQLGHMFYIDLPMIVERHGPFPRQTLQRCLSSSVVLLLFEQIEEWIPGVCYKP